MLAAIADCYVDARGVEVGVLMGSFDAQRLAGVAPLEIRQRGQQYGRGEERQRADPEFAAAVAPLPQHVATGLLQACQRHRDFCEVTLAVGGQPHRARAADEQLYAELLFQPADLVADRGRTECEVARGAAETQLRGGALEGEQRGERRDRPQRQRRLARWMNIAHLR
jgi:hypothetical protein